YFQPCAETFVDRFQFIVPSVTDRGETGDFDWEQVRRSAIVYVSLGTLFNTDVTFYRTCFEAFQGEDFQVIMSIGANVSRERLRGSVRRLLVEPRFREQAALVSESFRTAGGVSRAADAIRAFTRP